MTEQEKDLNGPVTWELQRHHTEVGRAQLPADSTVPAVGPFTVCRSDGHQIENEEPE